MRRIVPMPLTIALLCLLSLVVPLVNVSHQILASTPPPNLSLSGSTVSITNSFVSSQFDLDRSSFTISYPQDQAQEFRLEVTILQLMEVLPNQTTPLHVLDTLDLQTLTWGFSRLRNASQIQFGNNFRAQLSTVGHLQRGASTYPVNLTIVVFASQRQNDTAIIANDWLAIESVGGPTQINLDLNITNWPFRAPQNVLVLRLLLDGSQGTVRHHGVFGSTELFSTVGIVNDITQRQDASIRWLRRAIVDNTTSRMSADVMLNAFPAGETLDADIYYPSFNGGTLSHNLVVETSSFFQSAPFVPLRITELLFGATALFVLTLSITYLSRRSIFVLRRKRQTN